MIFGILVIINFVVVTKGAGRVSEVSARFTLDAMPGKQMAIDADLNAGIIDEREAQQRREEITQQADFYGAMDGASKFVKGDAIAGIIITVVNIAAGFIVGMVQMGMTAGESLGTFTVLTVGDGLVSQIPALLVSTSAGLVVTRSSGKLNLGQTLTLHAGEPLGNWRLDEAAGGAVVDQSAFGNDGVLGGSEGAAAVPGYQGYVTDQNTLLNIAVGNGVLANDLDDDGDGLTVTNLDITGTQPFSCGIGLAHDQPPMVCGLNLRMRNS